MISWLQGLLITHVTGEKITAFKVFYDAIDIVESKKEDDEKSY